MKKWFVQLDIAAPQIVMPESFQDHNTNMVVLDLGHLKFNNLSSTMSPDSQTNTDGENWPQEYKTYSMLNSTEHEI